MSDEGWRAPGRKRSTRPEPGEPYAPAPAAGPPSPADPYAAPGPAAPPSGPGTSAPPSRPGPYGPPAAPGRHTDAFATSDRHRDRVLAGPGYDSPAYRNDTAAVTSMVFGVIGIPIPGVCLLAIAFGHLALRRLRTSYEGGRGLAVAGLAMGYAMTAVWLGLLVLFLSARTLL